MDKWTIWTTPQRPNTLHAAIASALWARVPDAHIDVWHGIPHQQFETASAAIRAAVTDGFPAFANVGTAAALQEIVDLWNLCRYFRERAAGPESTDFFIRDNVYMKRQNRFYVPHWNTLCGYLGNLRDFAVQNGTRLSLVMLSTRERAIDTSTKKIQKFFCYGAFPYLELKAGIYATRGTHQLLTHILERLSVYIPGTSAGAEKKTSESDRVTDPSTTGLTDFVCSTQLADGTYWAPDGAFYTRFPLIAEYRRTYD